MTTQTTESHPSDSSRRYLRAAENFAKRPRKERVEILRRVLDNKKTVRVERKKK